MNNQSPLRPATWKNDRVLFIAQAGIIAAVYVVLTVVFAPFSFKEIQVRISEMLTILPFFFPAAVPGVFIGCIIGNIIGGAVLPDVVFGSLATLIGAMGTYVIGRAYRKRVASSNAYVKGFEVDQVSKSPSTDSATLRKNLIVAAIPPIVANALIVPFILKYAYAVPMPIPLMMLTVGIGEVISCGILGVLLGQVVARLYK